ncbi:MAG TPA: DUF2791 family P-loop domain-containing protein [Methanoregulaceae archaeon]|mgnify:CR=1 FL=1|nr:DUF2791 family P-loop domain-containing protein [Methanoregulaceae archaeon]
MDLEFALGDEINTPFGQAIVRQILSKTIKIELLSGVMRGQLIFIDPLKYAEEITFIKKIRPVVPKPPIVQPPPGTKIDRPILTQKRCIDSLRFGLVPTDYISELTLGFDTLKKWTESTLPHANHGNPSVHQIIGPFGEGKSHTLSIIRHLAFQEGYLVGSVEVDGKEVSLSKPETFLFHLFSALEGKNLNRAMPIIDVYRKALKRGFNGPFVAKSGHIDRIHEMYNLIGILERYGYLDDLGYLLEDVLTCSEDITASEVKAILIDETKDRINRNDIRLYPLIGRAVIDRPNEFIEALVATALVGKLAGYQGLIVTVDECEVEEALLAGENYRRKEQIFDALSTYFSGISKYVPAPLTLYFASVPSSSSEGDDSIEIDHIVQESTGKTYTLAPFNGWDPANNEQLAIVERIHDIYKKCYGCDGVSAETLIQNLNTIMTDTDIYDSGGIRFFMKRYISLLDSMYGPPSHGIA